jgi:hypothetical protein
MFSIAVITLSALMAAAVSADGATECDKLASNPEDPDRVSAGVPREEVKLEAAIAACEADVARQPSNTRQRYQLARVLFYAGETERAVREMRAAADAGNRQAQFVYGLLISNRREHAPSDMCLVEQYWLKSARAGRQAARVSYVHHALRGRFNGCRIQASQDEMTDLLARAQADAGNYYERLLIEDLTEQLAARGRAPQPAQ